MWAILRPTHRGGWRAAHPYRSTGQRVSDILWWAVVGTTFVSAVAYAVYLLQ